MEDLLSASPQPEAVFASHAQVKNGIISLCPTVDLIAIADQHESVNVYRFNGQLAFSKKRPNAKSEVKSICWKYDGKCLAIAWSFGFMEMLSSETGKVLLNGATKTLWTSGLDPDKETGTQETDEVSCLGWGVSFSDAASVKAKTSQQTRHADQNTPEPSTDTWDNKMSRLSLDDFLDRVPNRQRLDLDLRLPDRLATLDVEKVFPLLGLPPTPAPQIGQATNAGDDWDEVFSSQTSLDAIFHSNANTDLNAVSTLIVCSDTGKVKPVLYDAMSIGFLRLPYNDKAASYKAVHVASHPYTYTHALLVEVSDDNGRGSFQSQSRVIPSSWTKLVFVPLTLNAIRSAGTSMQLIASKATQLLNLFQYIDGVGRRVEKLFGEITDFPQNRLDLLTPELDEEEFPDPSDALYQLAATGICDPQLREWLIDIVGDRGHRRWETEVDSAYSKFINAVHENLLPAIERCSVVTCTLRGLASYQDSNKKCNIRPEQFTRALEYLRSMRLILHECLSYATEERRGFAAFSKWLKFQIGLQASGSDGDSDESIEQQAGLDYRQIFKYLKDGLERSRLAFFWGSWKPQHHDAAKEDRDEIMVYDVNTTAEVLKAFKEDRLTLRGPWLDAEVPFTFLCSKLRWRVKDATGEIGLWQQDQTSIPGGVVLEEVEEYLRSDMRMVFEHGDTEEFTTYVATVLKTAPSEVRVHQVKHGSDLDEVEKSVWMPDLTTVTLPTGEIKDLKFFNDTFVVLILSVRDTSYLLGVPFTRIISSAMLGRNVSVEQVRLQRLPEGHARKPTVDISLQEPLKMEPYILGEFPHADRFRPSTLVVNGRENRNTICVLGEDGRHFKVFIVGAKRDNNELTLPMSDNEVTPTEDG
ncbi:MAG: hypothetical protein M1821_010044 [Bathelium mastoideum]|nr:MAG: hypothetical protein M1821_010044 [Bathelium mastoideum]